MGHSNNNIRLDALGKLKDEMHKNGGDCLRYELSHIVENVCPLFSDKEYKIRETSGDLLRSLILHPFVAQCNALEPFYHLISVHLCCAMTHIVEKIQYSSLKLLDILVEHKPDFVRTYALALFDNFVEQISKSDLKGTRRILKNDPFKFTSTHTWRKNVLSRLSRMLNIVTAGRNTPTGSIIDDRASEQEVSVVASSEDGSRQSIVVFKSDTTRKPAVIDLRYYFFLDLATTYLVVLFFVSSNIFQVRE